MNQRPKRQRVKATQGWRNCVLSCIRGGPLAPLRLTQSGSEIPHPEPVALSQTFPSFWMSLCISRSCKTWELGWRNSSVSKVLTVHEGLSSILEIHKKARCGPREVAQRLRTLLLQKTQVQFPAPKWKLTSICNSLQGIQHTDPDTNKGETLMQIK